MVNLGRMLAQVWPKLAKLEAQSAQIGPMSSPIRPDAVEFGQSLTKLGQRQSVASFARNIGSGKLPGNLWTTVGQPRDRWGSLPGRLARNIRLTLNKLPQRPLQGREPDKTNRFGNGWRSRQKHGKRMHPGQGAQICFPLPWTTREDSRALWVRELERGI